MKPVNKSKNTRLINISYIVSILTYLIGLYFIAQGYLVAFLGIFPTLFFGIYLLYKNERRYGILLVVFFFVWIIIYYSYLPGKMLNL
ncbi:MAG: hypothetical protein ACLQG5_00805 [Methanobacterium sp.]|jgi:hypothetical protein